MSTESRSTRIWNVFYDKYGRQLKNDPSYAAWRRFTDAAPVDWVVRLFALARYEEEAGQPLVTREDNSSVCAKVVSDKLFGFMYKKFYPADHRERLLKQLEPFGIGLVKAGKQYQYLRTIHRLSGAVYLKVAKIAAGISPDKWIVTEGGKIHLCKAMQEEVGKYTNKDEGDDSDNGLASDVRNFFAKLQSAYRFCNAIPSFESCQHFSSELPDQVLKNILKELSWSGDQSENRKHTNANPFLPTFRINENGVVELGFPRASIRASADHPDATTVVFGFRTRNGRRPVYVRFRKNDDNWNPEADSALGFPPGEILSVLRSEFDDSDIQLSETDVTPGVLANPENSHLLFDSDGHPIDAKSSVVSGCPYCIVWLHGHAPVPVTTFDDDGGEIPVEAGGGAFTVPVRAAVVRIGEEEHPVLTNANIWLNLAGSFRNIRNPGGRIFFESGTYPFSDAFIENGGQVVRYRKSDGTIVSVGESTWSNPPKDILWDRGWIEFVCRESGDLLAKRAVTLLPKVNAKELEGSFALKGVPVHHVWFDDGSREVSVPISIPDTTDTVDGMSVEFSWNGFHFRFPIARQGITVSFPGTDIESFVLSPERQVVLAEEDFEYAVFHFAGFQNISVQRGITVSLEENTRKVSWHDLNSKYELAKETGDDWEFSADGTTIGQLFVFHPEKTAYDTIDGHPAVDQEKDGDGLFVRFWMAHRWKTKKLFLVCLPAHRQDGKAFLQNDKHRSYPITYKADTPVFDNSNGQLRVVLHFPGFYIDPTIRDDFGARLLSFVAIQDENNPGQFCPVSAGFAIERPDEWGEWTLSPEDDPYGLRRAMAVCDLPAIERIMMSKNSACRNWIRTFERDTLNTLSSFGLSNLDFFHAYRSEIVKADGSIEPSGYFFMAGWLLRERMIKTEVVGVAPSPRMKDAYSRKWSPLLRAFAPDEPDPDAANWKTISRNMGFQCNGSIHNGHVIWPFGGTFNDAVIIDETQKPPKLEAKLDLKTNRKQLEHLIKDVDQYWRSVFSNITFDPRKDDKTFDPMDPGPQPTPIIGTGLTSIDLETCLSRLAKCVAEWRKNPSINSAQRLRDLLLRVEELDDDLRNKLSQKPAWRDQLPVHTMTQRIAMKSWLFD